MFSVLLSVYSKEKVTFLRESLNSIFTQTLIPNEVVLVKDGPLGNELEDTIQEFVEKYPIIKIISLDKNQGLGLALNTGLKHCSYDLVARMDTDDIAKSDRFEKQIKIFDANPDIGVVGSWIDEFEGDITNITSTRKLPEKHDEIYSFAKSRNPINHPVVMFRKQAVIEAGGYQSFTLFEDYYLWVRMLLNGTKFHNIQESLLYFRFSSDMFKRRGGIKYAIDEYHFLRKLRELDFISLSAFMKNVPIRFFARIIPNGVRTLLYKKILRK